MRLTVGDIVELVCPDCSVRIGCGKLLCQTTGDLHIVVRVGVGGGRHFDKLCAKKLQRVLFLLALGLGNDDHRLVAKRVGNQRKPDAGVAGRTFHNRAAGT